MRVSTALLLLVLIGCVRLGPRVDIKPASRIYASSDVGFAAGLLAESGYVINLAARESGIVNTDWRVFLIEGEDEDWAVAARDRFQVSATAGGIFVQYFTECHHLSPTLKYWYWAACYEPTKTKRGVEAALKSRYKEIWTAIRDAAHAAAANRPAPHE